MKYVVTDDLMLSFWAKHHDLAERFKKGGLNPERALALMQDLNEGRWIPGLDPNMVLKIEVDRGKKPSLPKPDDRIDRHFSNIGDTKAWFEKHPTGLFVDGKAVKFCFSSVKHTRENRGMPKIKEIVPTLRGKKLLNGTDLDFLLSHQEFFPSDWRYDERFQQPPSIYFLGTTYSSPQTGGRDWWKFVRGCIWSENRWKEMQQHFSEDDYWDLEDAMAVIED